MKENLDQMTRKIMIIDMSLHPRRRKKLIVVEECMTSKCKTLHSQKWMIKGELNERWRQSDWQIMGRELMMRKMPGKKSSYTEYFHENPKEVVDLC